MTTKQGINASPGVAIGSAFVLDTEEFRIPMRTVDASAVSGELRALDAALEASRQEVSELRLAATRKLGAKTFEIFAFHEALIADPALRRAVADRVQSHRQTAAYAFVQEMNARQREFRNVADPYLKERVRDLIDIEKRVLRHILGRQREDLGKLSEPVIIIANDITPSQAISFDRRYILGFAVNVGGSTSHTAIISRELGIPAVVALNDITNDVSGGETVIIDGVHGLVVVNPDGPTLAKYQQRQQEYRSFESRLAEYRDLPAETLDHTHVSLMANIELAAEARNAIQCGAEGIGLYRTEFLYLQGDRMPSEQQQFETFRAAVRHAGGRPLTIRTVDLGADKMSDYLGPQHDHNPVLGLRSLRYCLQHLDLFKTHLRAILRAAVDGDVRIMFPMITTLIELRQAKTVVADVLEDLEEEGLPFGKNVPLGMMIETPAAAMMSASFVKEAAFVSIGTNDLTQYTLAVDRSNERVAHLFSPHNPAVLRLIRGIIRSCKRAKVPANVCGEMAGVPIYCQLLIGLGLRQFSMSPKAISEIKRVIRSTTIPQCEAIAARALKFDAEGQVISLLRDELHKIDPEAEA